MKLGRYILVLIVALTIGATARFAHHPRHTHGSFPQQAYIWQRAWTPALREAVSSSSSQFSSYTVLAGEVSFQSGNLNVARVAVDYSSLKSANIPIGLALRIGPYHGHFSSDDQTGKQLENLAALLLADAEKAGVQPAELQIDFDAADSQLGGYRLWIEAIQKRVAPTPVAITVLPSWLGRAEFPPMARLAGSYVLQVHSLNRPTSVDSPMTLCDPSAARNWVEQAGRIGVPFRVALPTYGYLVAFDNNGKFVGLSAESGSISWPRGTQVRKLSADPDAMAGLINIWTAERPACMAGVIWYRLPTADDALNWRYATLKSVMAGRSPRMDVRAIVAKSESTLFEIQLQNAGDADAPLGAQVIVTWDGADVIASDALGGFEKAEQPGQIIFRPLPSLGIERLAPGDHRSVGWVRLSADKEVHADVSPIHP